jgi:hypothetical protein
MNYADALPQLVDACRQADVAIEAAVVVRDAQYAISVFGPDVVREIVTAGYPGGMEIPWIVEDLYLYTLAEMPSRQTGYRHAVDGAELFGWEQERHVIADWNGNPISIHREGSVATSHHGGGAWTYSDIAPDLATFIDLLARWLRFFVVEHRRDIFDEGFEVSDAMRTEIFARVLGDADERYRMAAAGFLIGDWTPARTATSLPASEDC